MNTIYLVTLAISLLTCNTNDKKNNVTDQTDVIVVTDDHEWISLFDGKTFDGWHRYNHDTPSNAWIIKDGAMTFDPSVVTKEDRVHDLVTDSNFTSFELSLEWNIAEGGNSGVFWGVVEDKKYHTPYLTGPEIQVLDNERHPDAKANPKFHQAGALYDMVQPTQDVCKPAGTWNHILLSINHNTNKGSVALNGVEIVSFPVSGAGWDALIANSKFKNWDAFGKFKTGKIGLQDHGDVVSYRNIKIREL